MEVVVAGGRTAQECLDVALQLRAHAIADADAVGEFRIRIELGRIEERGVLLCHEVLLDRLIGG